MPKGKKRKGKDLFREFDVAAYSKKNFGMFGGEDVERYDTLLSLAITGGDYKWI